MFLTYRALKEMNVREVEEGPTKIRSELKKKYANVEAGAVETRGLAASVVTVHLSVCSLHGHECILLVDSVGAM